jgi:hypothetical protein
MQTFRFAHVVTCWVYLAALVLQFAFAGYGVMGGDIDLHMAFGGTFLHIFIPLALMVTAWLGKLGWRQVLLGFGLFVLLTVQIMLVGIGQDMDSNAVQGMHPAFAFLSAGYVYFWVLGPALDAAPAPLPGAPERGPVHERRRARG